MVARLENDLLLSKRKAQQLQDTINAVGGQLFELQKQREQYRMALAEFDYDLDFLKHRAQIVKMFHFRDVRDMQVDAQRRIAVFDQDILHRERENLKRLKELEQVTHDITVLEKQLGEYGHVYELLNHDY